MSNIALPPVSWPCDLCLARLDVGSIVTAFLHDVIEDTGLGRVTLEKNFGSEIADAKVLINSAGGPDQSTEPALPSTGHLFQPCRW